MLKLRKKLLALMAGLLVAGVVSAAEMVKIPLTKLDGTVMTKEMEVPVYGGLVNSDGPYGVEGWDPRFVAWVSMQAVISQDGMIEPNWYVGQSGTEEFDFARNSPIIKYYGPGTFESYAFHGPNRLVGRLRQGMTFWGKDDVVHVNDQMANDYGREFTADDLIAAWEESARFSQSFHYGKRNNYTFTALDRYTIQIDTTVPDPTGVLWLNLAGLMFPHTPASYWDEAVDKNEWKNRLTIGAFIPSEWQQGVQTTFKKNPNYWQYDPFFPQNRLPYLDFYRYIVFDDITTKVAALRTYKLDVLNQDVQSVPWQDYESIQETNPDIQGAVASPATLWLQVRMDQLESKSPWVNKKVRHAALMAIPHFEVAQEYYKGNSSPYFYMTYEHWKPLYISYEELQAERPELAELWQYNPEKAKQLLAEAGYPDGFDTVIHTRPDHQHWVELYQGYFQDVGIRAEVKVMEATQLRSMQMSMDPNVFVVGTDAGNPEWGPTNEIVYFAHPTDGVIPAHGRCEDGVGAEGCYKDDWLVKNFDELQNLTDLESYTKKWRELALHLTDMQYSIQVPDEQQFRMWQGWIKGYHGANRPLEDRVFKYVWIDAAEKKQRSGREANE